MNPRLALALAVTIGTLLVGCTPDTGPTPSPTQTTSTTPTPVPSPPVTPSPSPTPTAIDSFPDDVAGDSAVQAEIRTGWQNYYTVLDKFLRDPDLKDLTELQHVTTGQEATDIVGVVVSYRDSNLVRQGDLILRDAVISEPVTNADGATTAEVNYCFDPQHLRIVDATTGEPAANAIKPDQTMKVKDLMEKMKDGSWRVALSETELAKC